MVKYLPSIAILLLGNEILSYMALIAIALCFCADLVKARFGE